MNRKILLSSILLLVILLSAAGQQYKARGYWKMEHDSVYISLLNLQKAGSTLSSTEQSFLDDFKIKLAAYFERMPDVEKSDYYKYRAQWNGKPGNMNLREEDQVYAGERSTFTRYVFSSGIWGGLYGLSFDYIFNVTGPGVAGLPLITGGMSSIIPVMTIKDKKVTSNSLLLSNHGKSIGAFQGAMLGLLFTGGTSDESDGKIIAGLGTLSSIGLGRLGYSLGKNKDWSQGRVNLYRHYGWLMSLEGVAVMSSISSDSPRLYALGSLVGGFGGYMLADHVANRNDFTRGDVISIQTFSILNAGLGFGILMDTEPNSTAMVLIPAAGAMAGTLLSQAWIKNARLTNQQGRNIALSTTGGALVGLGLSVIIFPGGSSAYYIIPYITGLATYAIVSETYRKKNMEVLSLDKKSSNKLHFSFMPQNILINNKMVSSGRYHPGSGFNMLPAFVATISF